MYQGEIYRTAGPASAQRCIDVAKRRNGIVVHSTGAKLLGMSDAWVVIRQGARIPDNGVVAFDAAQDEFAWLD